VLIKKTTGINASINDGLWATFALIRRRPLLILSVV